MDTVERRGECGPEVDWTGQQEANEMGRHDGGARRKGGHDRYRRGRQPGGGRNQTMWHDGREVELRQHWSERDKKEPEASGIEADERMADWGSNHMQRRSKYGVES